MKNKPERVVLGEGVAEYYHGLLSLGNTTDSVITIQRKDIYVSGLNGKKIRLIAEIIPNTTNKRGERMKIVDYKGKKFVFLNEELSDYEMDEFPDGVSVVVVNYEAGSYDGSGDLVMVKDGKYYLHNCSHCSCNGPTDGMNLLNGYDSLEAIKTSKDYEEDIKPILEWFEVNK